MIETNKIICGDSLEVLKTFPNDSIDMCLTSPPYYGLRDYGIKGQIGLEENPQEYINKIVEVSIEVMRVLKPTGVFFLNLGDSYATHRSGKDSEINFSNEDRLNSLVQRNAPNKKNKSNWNQEKQKLLIPHRIAIALQEKGFIIRDDIVWIKKMVMYPDKKSFGSTMPFPVKDKLLPATEYIFQIVKSKKYYFNLEDVKTEIKNSTIERARRPISSTYTNDIEGNPYINHNGIQNANKKWAIMDLNGDKHQKINTREDKNVGNMERPQKVDVEKANPTNAVMFRKMNQNSKRLPQQHFASYPLTLADFFIDIGCPENGIVLDPFMGSGTTGLSALKQNKRFIGIELNPKYVEIANNRLKPYLEQTKLKLLSKIGDNSEVKE
ncbi:MAG TPA: site-specific DNA-methyltransferase [Candidatus Pacearchaeota archaeon]|nr:site-specific DNA-methyltransferase [Candidatus Pacearchaeota archaeon]